MTATLALIATTLFVRPGQFDVTNDQILAMGHDKWIAKVREEGDGSFGSLAEAEKRFTIALTIQSESRMETHPEGLVAKELQLLIANLAKSSCRVGDFMTYEKPHGHYYNAKAGTQAAMALHSFLSNRAPQVQLSQNDVWEEYKSTKVFHENSRDLVTGFAGRSGGYTAEQHMLEYESLAYFTKKIFTVAKNSTTNQKQSLFYFTRQMIRISKGDDPMP